MKLEQANNAIRTKWQKEIEAKYELPTQYDNVAFDSQGLKIWARLAILSGESQQITLGVVKTYRTPGILTASVFIPQNGGDRDALVMSTYITTAFGNVNVSGISFRTPSAIPLGITGEWYQVNVTIPYYFDDNR